MATTSVVAISHTIPAVTKIRDYLNLTKPEVNLLILMAATAGFYLGERGPFHWFGLINTLIGTLLVASGTAALNQWMERKYDALMRRTASRPLPGGRINPSAAFVFGVSLSLAGASYLALTVNGLSSLLAISTLLSYLLVYTPLKRRTPLCTLLGAIPGAMPTLIGWSGASGRIDGQAWLLFAVLFLWQFPHFLAIALMYREDYDRAGYRMLPHFDADSRFTRFEIVAFTGVLIILTILGSPSGVVFLAVLVVAGVLFMYHSLRLLKSTSRALSARLVHASVLYLPVVLGVMMLGKT